MKIHKEGYKVIPVIFVLLVIFDATVFLFTGKSFVFFIIFSFSVIFLLFNFLFFRDPQVVKSVQQGEVLSVADGTVVVIEPTIEEEYFKDERIQVSVFMSIYNVHINHIPVAGQIVYQKYHPGKFLPAYHAKSSGENERFSTVIRTSDGVEILVRQVAGILARRIISYKNTGNTVDVEDQLGFIRYGSRVDLFFPKSAQILVKMEQKVKGGKTIIAQI